MYHLVYDLHFRAADSAAKHQLEILPISARYRGWQYESDEFRPPYPDPPLSMTDLLGHGTPPTPKHLERNRISGDLVHSLYTKLASVPATAIKGVTKRSKLAPVIAGLLVQRDQVVDALIGKSDVVRDGLEATTIDLAWVDARKRELRVIWDHEMRLMAGLAQYELVSHPNQSIDIVQSKCIPFTAEMPVDGSRIGLSANLQIDARLIHRASMVIDIKTGDPSGAHHTSIAGYAMALESEEATPVDMGCVYYVSVPAGSETPLIKCDVFGITDALRQQFLARRNQALVGKNEGGTPIP